MELVLSAGSLGDNEGVPFRNEDVQEWSHVDRLTGMLERARIETGRWRTNEQGMARSYGKKVDSRERNSVDGSLVQKARRQVEIFQSQGTGGKSLQVVRASQWSSSRSTDSTFHMQHPLQQEVKNRISLDSLNERNKVSDSWELSEEDSMLNELSYLCRKIHNEVINLNGASTFAQEPVHRALDESCCKPFEADNHNNNEEEEEKEEESTSFLRNLQDENVESLPRQIKYSALSDIIGPVNSKLALFRDKDSFSGTGLSNRFVSNGVSTVLFKGINGTSNEEKQSIPGCKKSNKTVVHLGNDPNESSRINVTAIDLKDEGENASRPVKKVGFSKTEIHFAPDSGKVNIVETDGKPPPSNKFRRRRRNVHSLASTNKNPSNTNLPLVHFGDTNYEKLIFGGGKNVEENKEWKLENNEEDKNKIDEKEPRLRGHTTTINFVANANGEPAKMASGANESQIQLRFDNNCKSIFKVQENPLVTRTTKMTVQMPLIMPQISRPLKYPTFSALKSVQLILSLNKSRNDFEQNIIRNYVSDSDEIIENFITFMHENKNNRQNRILNSIEYGKKHEKDHRESNDEASKKSIPNKNIVTTDKENNEVLMNIVTTHKPIIARVEDDHNPPKKPENSSSPPSPKVEENGHFVEKKMAEPDPTYANVFKTESGPIYENVSTKNQKKQKIQVSTETKKATKSRSRDVKKSASPNKPVTKLEAKVEKSPIDVKSGSKTASRAKKPVEVVYETAVYNMRNEKLSKPTAKSREVRKRGINDLICGIKSKSKNSTTQRKPAKAI